MAPGNSSDALQLPDPSSRGPLALGGLGHGLWPTLGHYCHPPWGWASPSEPRPLSVGTSLLQEVVYLVSQGADPDEIGLMNIDEQLPVLEYPQPGLDIIKVPGAAPGPRPVPGNPSVPPSGGAQELCAHRTGSPR